MSRRKNPRTFYHRIFVERKLSEQKSWGFSDEEFYPYLIFSGNPFSEQQIHSIDAWLEENKSLMPPSLQNLSFHDVVLLIRFSQHYQHVTWHLYHAPTDLILGSGLLTVSHDGRYLDTVVTGLEFQGFGIYPIIIKCLYRELGPLRSDIHFNWSAGKVWERLGAQFDGKRWVLD